MADKFRYDLIASGAGVLCALSGGADSMYLLCRLLEGAERGGYFVRAAHFGHGLRSTAGRDEAFVRDWCERRGVPLTVGRGDVAAEAKRRGKGLEETGRELRYAFLRRTAAETGCTLIATGHHAMDNAETVLMDLIRGCGLKGLTGIPEQRGELIRPMLGVDRAEIERYLEKAGVPHVEDESNTDLSYTRNRVRLQVLPLLEELNPQAALHIAQTAAALREDEKALSQAANLLLYMNDGGDGRVKASALAGAPRPVALRAIGRMLERTGLGDGRTFREGALALAAGKDPSARLDVPGGVVRREYEQLVFEKGRRTQRLCEVPLAPGETFWGDWHIACAPAVCPEELGTPERFYVRQGEYTIRSRRGGDGLRPPNRHYKSLQDWMTDLKIPAGERDMVPVLALDGGAVAAGGIGVDGKALARPGEPALEIAMEKRSAGRTGDPKKEERET